MTFKKYLYAPLIVGAVAGSVLGTEITPTEQKVQALERRIDTTETMIDSLREANADTAHSGFSQAKIDIKQWEAQKDSLIKVAIREEGLKRKASEKDTVEVGSRFPNVVVEGYVGNEANGVRVGAGYGPFSVFLDKGTSEDRIVKDIRVPLNSGRYATGIERETGIGSFGLDLEAKFASRGKVNFFAGVGLERISYNREVEEKVFSGRDELLDASGNSSSEKRNSGKGYLGLEVPVSDNVSVRALGGFGRGGFAGIGFKYNPQRK